MDEELAKEDILLPNGLEPKAPWLPKLEGALEPNFEPPNANEVVEANVEEREAPKGGVLLVANGDVAPTLFSPGLSVSTLAGDAKLDILGPVAAPKPPVLLVDRLEAPKGDLAVEAKAERPEEANAEFVVACVWGLVAGSGSVDGSVCPKGDLVEVLNRFDSEKGAAVDGEI